MNTDLGIAGRLAQSFLNSKLTPLFIAASLALGIFSVAIIPREEEPQILVPCSISSPRCQAHRRPRWKSA